MLQNIQRVTLYLKGCA